jgi:hypothetical protein
MMFWPETVAAEPLTGQPLGKAFVHSSFHKKQSQQFEEEKCL